MTKILVSLTTYKNPDWQKNIADLKKFGIKEFAFFPTTIESEDDRTKILREIKKELPDAVIPFCHVRHDSTSSEIGFMIKHFQTKKFNIHPNPTFVTKDDYSAYIDMIYIENAGTNLIQGLPEEVVKNYAGICLDLAHLENCRRLDAPAYTNDIKLTKKYTIGMNHISAMTDKPEYVKEISSYAYERHYLEDLNQVDYVKRYWPNHFGEYAAIEMYNSIESQLEIKKYIEKILGL